MGQEQANTAWWSDSLETQTNSTLSLQVPVTAGKGFGSFKSAIHSIISMLLVSVSVEPVTAGLTHWLMVTQTTDGATLNQAIWKGMGTKPFEFWILTSSQETCSQWQMLLEERLPAPVARVSICVLVTPEFDQVAAWPVISTVPNGAARLSIHSHETPWTKAAPYIWLTSYQNPHLKCHRVFCNQLGLIILQPKHLVWFTGYT